MIESPTFEPHFFLPVTLLVTLQFTLTNDSGVCMRSFNVCIILNNALLPSARSSFEMWILVFIGQWKLKLKYNKIKKILSSAANN
jgi:hypothetical protein